MPAHRHGLQQWHMAEPRSPAAVLANIPMLVLPGASLCYDSCMCTVLHENRSCRALLLTLNGRDPEPQVDHLNEPPVRAGSMTSSAAAAMW